MDTLQLGRFIERIGMPMFFSRADVQTLAHAISICFSKPGTTTTQLKLQIPCQQSDWQLSLLTQICDCFSPVLFRIEDLGIFMTQHSTEKDNKDMEKWVELICAFSDTRELCMASKLATDILHGISKIKSN